MTPGPPVGIALRRNAGMLECRVCTRRRQLLPIESSIRAEHLQSRRDAATIRAGRGGLTSVQP
jgi:hypothetical protein